MVLHLGKVGSLKLPYSSCESSRLQFEALWVYSKEVLCSCRLATLCETVASAVVLRSLPTLISRSFLATKSSLASIWSH
jgi:hypothetical protein